MFKNPRHIFFSLLLLTAVLCVFALPENFRLKFQLGPIAIDRVINPPTININILGMRVQKSLNTHLGLDLSGGTHVVLEADMKDIKESDRLDALNAAKQVIERRVNFFGVSEPIVQTARTTNTYRIIVELPGVTNIDDAVKTIGQTAKLEFRELTNLSAATEAATPEAFFAATTTTGLTGKELKRATMAFSQQTGEPEVLIEFTPEGTQAFAEITKRMVGKPLAIFLDQQLVSAPVVRQEITDGHPSISGSFTKDTAKMLALQLNAGALPVPVTIIEKRIVGATLGQESIVRSIRAGLVGLSIVAIFMILKYGFLGLLADMSLILYGLISFAFIRFIPITLTLPGIAGLLLSIGMAVDSNILIFERYKEEKRNGKPWKMAMELGFGKAWDSIRDANITTLLTCLILFNPANWQFLPSSGMVRGFAVTLGLGVIVGLFTGLVVTRTLIRVLYHPRKEQS